MRIKTLMDIAKKAECDSAISDYEESIEYLETNSFINIAVLGDSGSGKTTLINRLAGAEVRHPSIFPSNQKPLRVIFKDEEAAATTDIDVVKAENSVLRDVALNEIIDIEEFISDGKISPQTEKTDAIIYVMSAYMVCTASDIENIRILSQKFPVMIYVSKMDDLDKDDTADVLEYATSVFRSKLNNLPVFISDKPDSILKLTNFIAEIDIKDIREYHISLLECEAKEKIIGLLKNQLNDLVCKRQEREKEYIKSNSPIKDDLKIWNELKLPFMEKEQETLNKVKRIIFRKKAYAKKNAHNFIKSKFMIDAFIKKPMLLKDEFGDFMKNILDDTKQEINEETTELIESHVNWLIDAAKDVLSKSIQLDSKLYENSVDMQIRMEKINKLKTFKKQMLKNTAGFAGVLGVLLPINIGPTIIIALPSFAIAGIVYASVYKDSKNYEKKLIEYIESTIETNFDNFYFDVKRQIEDYYSSLIIKLNKADLTCENEAISYDDIDEKVKQIKSLLSEIN